MKKLLRAAIILTLPCACSPVNPAPITPTAPSTTSPTTIFLTGQVTDAASSAPITDAIVVVNELHTGSNGSGSYGLLATLHQITMTAISTFVVTGEYEHDIRYIRGTPQDIRLHRTERINAGESKAITVTPDDTLCSNNIQDPLLAEVRDVCRTVRVVAASDGVMRLEAISATSEARPLLEIETTFGPHCCSERLENPTSITVTAGSEIVAMIGMPVDAASSQSFTLITSFSPK